MSDEIQQINKKVIEDKKSIVLLDKRDNELKKEKSILSQKLQKLNQRLIPDAEEILEKHHMAINKMIKIISEKKNNYGNDNKSDENTFDENTSDENTSDDNNSDENTSDENTSDEDKSDDDNESQTSDESQSSEDINLIIRRLINKLEESSHKQDIQFDIILKKYNDKNEIKQYLKKNCHKHQELLKTIEDKHMIWTKNKQDKIKILDEKLSEHYKNIIPISEKIDVTKLENKKEEIKKIEKIISSTKKTIKKLRSNQQEINDINNNINLLNKNLIDITQSELPRNIIQYLEETAIFDIEDTIDKLQLSVSKQFIKKVKDSLKNNTRDKINNINLEDCSDYGELKHSLSESNIYRYLEDYQDKFESSIKHKENTEKEIHELNVKKNKLLDEIKRIPEEVNKLEHQEKTLQESLSYLNKAIQWVNSQTQNDIVNEKIKIIENEKNTELKEENEIYKQDKEKYLDIQTSIEIKNNIKNINFNIIEINEKYKQLIMYQQQVDNNILIKEEMNEYKE